jgi:hypothetical protein
MWRLLFGAVAIVLVGSAHAGRLVIGDPAPQAEIQAAPDRTVRVAPLGDSGTLVVFHSPACPASVAAEPELIEIGNAATARLVHTTFVEPSAASPGAAARAAASRGVRFNYVADASGNAVRAFGASVTPEAFLFDASGRLVYHGGAGASLATAVDAMLARQPVPVAESAIDGCPITAAE